MKTDTYIWIISFGIIACLIVFLVIHPSAEDRERRAKHKLALCLPRNCSCVNITRVKYVVRKENRTSTKMRFKKQLTHTPEHFLKQTSPVIKRSSTFSQEEKLRVHKCLKRKMENEYHRNWNRFLTGGRHVIRWRNHTYLNRDSTVIDVGGNSGGLSDRLLYFYKPRRYIIMEPIEKYYKVLKRKYAKRKNVLTLNFGLGKEDRTDMVKIIGSYGEGTSRFKAYGVTSNFTVPLRQVNASKFFIGIGVGVFDVDLITINCEGCEFDVLDALLDFTLVEHFRHIQVSYHHLEGAGNTYRRWCEYQELLSRSHRVVYQYPFFWESWTRKDLKV